MLYIEDLEEVIFEKHKQTSEEPDELIIISGYLGPAPVERLSELPFKTTIVGGMYPSGIDARLLTSLNKVKSNNSNLAIKYSTIEVHSKIYIWRYKGKIISALIGSANFSSNGLRTDYRESLADVTRDSYKPLERYYDLILSSSLDTPSIKSTKKVVVFENKKQERDVNISNIKYSYEIPLFKETKTKFKHVPEQSGLNWGNSKGHVAIGDAYIPIPKELLKENQYLIHPYKKDYYVPEGKKKRLSDPIEIIWDDGTIMEASLEGTQKFNNQSFPKNLTSFSSKKTLFSENGKRMSKKSIMGRYLRKRIGVSLEKVITIDDLKNYGRDTITLSLINEGVYYCDFSVKK